MSQDDLAHEPLPPSRLDGRAMSEKARRLAEEAGTMPDGAFRADQREEILRAAELQQRRSQDDTLNRMGVAIQKLMEQMGEVQKALVRIEAQDVKQLIVDTRADLKTELAEARADTRAEIAAARTEREALNVRVQALENDKERRSGALSMVDWLQRATPWLIAVGGILIAYLKKS